MSLRKIKIYKAIHTYLSSVLYFSSFIRWVLHVWEVSKEIILEVFLLETLNKYMKYIIKMARKILVLKELPCFLCQDLWVKIKKVSNTNNVRTILTQILRHSWLERHFTILWTKVHLLGQILDYNGQIWLRFEYNGIKKP